MQCNLAQGLAKVGAQRMFVAWNFAMLGVVGSVSAVGFLSGGLVLSSLYWVGYKPLDTLSFSVPFLLLPVLLFLFLSCYTHSLPSPTSTHIKHTRARVRKVAHRERWLWLCSWVGSHPSSFCLFLTPNVHIACTFPAQIFLLFPLLVFDSLC